MLRNIILIIILGLTIFSTLTTHSKDFEIRRRNLTFYKPPFSLKLPSEFYLAHSFLQVFPSENSRTRAYIFIKEKNKEVEELLIIQIADRTNPQAGPMIAPPLKPYTEKKECT